ncbi:HLA class I histocompatibility antigen, alpha chain G-like isoform X3 [Pseudonaja textilis]|uniref:HLA class I histocompatibility antigen, alpha chain G-like isoform X3 n=1 Tax=Pseudonaja textilis TaxID=8673 RepID=UPI000EA88034|nr:HLA class I histocompatibility antigen, alpha chain G-like isoform X3 [Pseudonaja textilis]
MALRSAPLGLLVLLAVALRESCVGASSHSLKYFLTAISDPSQGLPQFVAVGYMDGQAFVHYDSHSRRMKPRVSWMEKVEKDDPQYRDRNTRNFRGAEEQFRGNLETLRNRYNQSEGFHTIQMLSGCELCTDGKTKEGFEMHGYDGRTFLTFDTETRTWVALDLQAQITKRKWDADQGFNQRKKAYLEEICIEWLGKYLSYEKEMLQRTEPPEVTVNSRTEADDGMETHVCRLDGFYPREIDASWRRDGEVWLEETFHGFLVPNADGTYHYWLSIRIDPKERGRYRCHVEHDGLPEPLDLALEEPTNSKLYMEFIVGCVMGGFVLVLVVFVVLASKKPRIMEFFKKHQDYYKAAPTSDKGSNSSAQGLFQEVTRTPTVQTRGATRPLSSPIAVETPSLKREEGRGTAFPACWNQGRFGVFHHCFYR